jgi:hypothetical protein
VSQPRRVAFDTARDRPDLAPLRRVLLGMNALLKLARRGFGVVLPDVR